MGIAAGFSAACEAGHYEGRDRTQRRECLEFIQPSFKIGRVESQMPRELGVEPQQHPALNRFSQLSGTARRGNDHGHGERVTQSGNECV
jgi:hypothetical protein